MTFKHRWEQTATLYSLPEGTIDGMVRQAYPQQKLLSHKVLSGGCANLNIKIQLEGLEWPFILRIYLRDQDAAYREQKLGELLKATVPVPLTHYVGDHAGYRFAITDFLPGISLRELLLGEVPYDMKAIMEEVGRVLSKISSHTFPQNGFFERDLKVIDYAPNGYRTLARESLDNHTVASQLSPEMILKIRHYLDNYSSLFPDDSESHLVHADFDPANILVEKREGHWRISGILDWEFSFSGATVCDVASMLRYVHHMPPEFAQAFLKGLETGGIHLPVNWRLTIHMVNLVSLLDCLARADPAVSPCQCADICELIDHILRELDEMIPLLCPLPL